MKLSGLKSLFFDVVRQGAHGLLALLVCFACMQQGVAQSLPSKVLQLPSDQNLAPKRMVYKSQVPSGQLTLPLGPIERIDGQWQPENRRVLKGLVERRTLEFSPAQSEAAVFSAYRQLALAQGARELFSCQGRDCGRSNNWANSHFKILQLYGREDSQRLSSLWFEKGGEEYYLVLYQVRRGNKRIYLQQELLSRAAKANAPAPVVSASQLWRNWQGKGFLRLSTRLGSLNSQGQVESSWLLRVAEVLASRPRLKLLLVAHSPEPNALQASERLAAELLAKLSAQGLDVSRIEAKGLGSWAPLEARPEGPRLDLILQ